MSEQHTPEPWNFHGNGIFDSKGINIGTTGIDRPNRHINARRIVACVNACKDITNEQLEANFLQWMCDENARLRRINERLVEDLESIRKTIEVMASQPKSTEKIGGNFVYAYDWFCDESRGIDERISQALAAAKEE